MFSRFRKRKRRPTPYEVEKALEQHAVWLDSEGLDGMRAEFKNRDLRKLDFKDKPLRGAAFIKCKLEKRNLKAVIFAGSHFIDCTLKQANFRHCSMTASQVKGSHLGSADFRDAQLTGSVWKHSQFPKANFRGAVLDRMVFESIKAKGARMERSSMLQIETKQANGDKQNLDKPIFRGVTSSTPIYRVRSFSLPILLKPTFSKSNSRKHA